MSEEFDDILDDDEIFGHNDDYDYESESDETKEVIEGYTVQSSVSIGSKRIVYAKDETGKMEMPYLKCIVNPNALFTSYENGIVSDSFEEIMKLFADDIKAEAIILETENRARGASYLPPFHRGDLIADKDENIVGKVVAINPKYLYDGYKSMPYQLFYVTGGSGANENHYGNACFCKHMYTGDETRIERYEILGIVPEDKLPDFAKKTLDNIKEQEKPRKKGWGR